MNRHDPSRFLTRAVAYRNGYTGKVLLVQPQPESAELDKRGAIRARRARLQSALLAKVPEGVIQFDKKLTRLEDLGNRGALLVFQNGTESVADLVVGAEGIRSVRDTFSTEAELSLTLSW